MKIKIGLFKDRVFLYAILFSLIWHIFWLSSVSVVAVPKVKKQVRFSNVSFLGPIVDRPVLKVSAGPRECTALEKKYLEQMKDLSSDMARSVSSDNDAGAGLNNEGFSVNDEEWSKLTVAFIDTHKIEPGRDID